MDCNLKLSKDEGALLTNASAYRRLTGRLSYLTLSRPNIAFAINKLSQFMSSLQDPHLKAAHHLLCYLKNAPGQGFFFPNSSNFYLTAYADADSGSRVDTRRSISSFRIFLGEVLVSRKSKKQAMIARSSAEAEYHAMAIVTSELVWLINLLQDFGISISSVKLLCDSMAAMHITSNPFLHERTKHIDIDCHFVREHVQSALLKLIHVKSQH